VGFIEGLQVVWFKRDLRVRDHAALSRAAEMGPVLPLYLFEPAVVCAPDFDELHYQFIRGCLVELKNALAGMGQPLIVRMGEATHVLDGIHRQWRIQKLWSHEETGNAITFQRDLQVAEWASSRGIGWEEIPQNGVIRKLRDRKGWSRQWDARMRLPGAVPPERLVPLPGIEPGSIPSAQELGLRSSSPRELSLLQPGGATHGEQLLRSFLGGRGVRYSREMSSPVQAANACSRLSAHLAWGSISIRTAAQAAMGALPVNIPKGCVRSFLGRLHWHCHFMQKLECEPGIEFTNFNRAYDGLRETQWNACYYERWTAGLTGYPFVDACMRYLRAGGWINFRMRAMLVSFAAYDLWLDWRGLKDFLACQFADYEPGIHFSQLQMQSGVTGINTLRIYNPVKQGLDHDPDGVFIRRWVPELEHVRSQLVHTPWESSLDCLNRGYPERIVDHKTAVALARQKLAVVRRSPDARAMAARVFLKHGSRKRPGSRRESAHRSAGTDLPSKQSPAGATPQQLLPL